MAKGTILFLFLLAIIATLLFGINIGKKINLNQPPSVPSPTLTSIKPTLIPTIPVASNSATTVGNTTTYINNNCGYQISYPAAWTRLESDPRSVALENPATSSGKLAIVCQEEIPRVPLPEEKIEDIKLGTISAKLYHDSSQKDGTPIDKVIATIPGKNLDRSEEHTSELQSQFHLV